VAAAEALGLLRLRDRASAKIDDRDVRRGDLPLGARGADGEADTAQIEQLRADRFTRLQSDRDGGLRQHQDAHRQRQARHCKTTLHG
jgi:hypothetical protein